MASDDQVLESASDLLLITRPGSITDYLLFDHSVRVRKLTNIISRFSDFANLRIDRQALAGAAIYHDLGWSIQVRKGLGDPLAVLDRPTSDDQRRQGAELASERLGSILTVQQPSGQPRQ